jgi:hypothetical protein
MSNDKPIPGRRRKSPHQSRGLRFRRRRVCADDTPQHDSEDDSRSCRRRATIPRPGPNDAGSRLFRGLPAQTLGAVAVANCSPRICDVSVVDPPQVHPRLPIRSPEGAGRRVWFLYWSLRSWSRTLHGWLIAPQRSTRTKWAPELAELAIETRPQ